MIASQVCEGIDLGAVTKTWTKLAADGERLELLKNLKKLDIGLNEAEDNLTDLTSKFRSSRMKVKGTKSECVRGVVREPMKVKLMDARATYQESITAVNRSRSELKLILGDNTWKFRSVIRYLKGEQQKVSDCSREKNQEKINNLRKKHKSNVESELDKVPADIESFRELSVFDRGKYDLIEKESYEVLIIGDIELSEEARGILTMHPQFSVLDNLS